MDCRALATITAAVVITTSLHLLAGPCAAAARPLVGRLPVPTSSSRDEATTTTTSSLALAPTATHHHQQRAAAGDEDDVDDAGATTREGKWLPFAGAHHLPPAYWAHKPVPWVGAAGELGGPAAGAVEEGSVGGEGGEDEEETVRDRERRHRRRPSYDSDGTSTRKEQLAMWASLLNPKGRGRSDVTGWLPAPGIGEAADDEPAKASDTPPVEGAEGDEPSGSSGQSQTYWGSNGN